LLSVGVRSHAAIGNGMKHLVLFVNNLRQSVEIFVKNSKRSHPKDIRRAYCYATSIGGTGENLAVVAVTGPHESALYL
jgi:hypothetical protein